MQDINSFDSLLRAVLPKQRIYNGKTYKKSQYVLEIEYKNRYYIYNTLTSQCIELSGPLCSVEGEDRSRLIEDYCLVPEDKDECTFYEGLSRVIRTLKNKQGYTGYTILPTTYCNARCIYCYESGIDQISMTPECVKQTIEFIKSTCASDSISIQWFGGEPLMGIGTIDSICEGLRSENINYSSSMITNGSLITPRVIELMKTRWNLKHLQISMDGDEEDYIERKRYYSYRNYYHQILKNINELTDNGITVSVRANIDEDNWFSVSSFIEDLAVAIKNKSMVRVYFSPIYDNRLSKWGLSLWQKAIEGKKMLVEAGFTVKPQFWFAQGFRVFHCMADADGIVIGPDGKIYPCEHCLPESSFGNIYDGVTDNDTFKKYTNVGKTRVKCRNCMFLPICTSYSMCPVEDDYCFEARELDTKRALKEFINHIMDSKSNSRTVGDSYMDDC